MTTIEEYVRMAKDAEKEGAHVAALMYYRTAIEETGYNPNAAPILLAAIQHAQGLKKEGDRQGFVVWAQIVAERIKPTDLEGTINQEIAKLKAGGNKHATAS